MYKIKLSPYHKIFYNEWKLNTKSTVYNIVFDQVLSSSLKIPILDAALQRFVSDHLLFNSHALRIDDECYWVANSNIESLEQFSINSTKVMYSYVSAPFDLESGPLYRFAIFNQSDGNHRLVIVLHHILIDGNAFDELVTEISNYYNDHNYKIQRNLDKQVELIRNTTDSLYISLQQGQALNKEFWHNSLSEIEALDLRFICSDCDSISKQAVNPVGEVHFSFNSDLVFRLSNLKVKYGLSEYMLSQLIFAILLNRYTSQKQFAVSYPVAIKECNQLIYGSGINTSILPYRIDQDTTLRNLMSQIKAFISNIRENNYNYYPISEIIEDNDPHLLDVFFTQSHLKDTAFSFNNVNAIKINRELNLDLPTKILFEQEIKGEVLNFYVRYNRSRTDTLILNNFIKHYKQLVNEIVFDLELNIINKPVSAYEILNKQEYQQIVYDWNRTQKLYSSYDTIHQLFEEQVERTPNNIAIVYEGVSLTYNELNHRSNQLAHYLREEYNAIGDNLICLYLNRSIYMLVAVLGVLKSGSAYVPIDITCPEQRALHIVSDTNAKLLITDKHNYNHISNITINNSGLSIIAIDSCDIECTLNQQLATNPKLNITGSNLVYVMYTSGTTGNPKGVMLEHHGVVIRIMAMIEKSGICAKSKYLFKTNYIFDVSFSDIFMTLLSGAALYITKSIFDIEEICRLIKENDINVCHFVPSQLGAIYDHLRAEDIFNKLQIIHVSGEKFNKSLIHDATNIKYVNYYGPTETGEVSYDITDFKHQRMDHLKLETIGYPLNQSTLYVLDVQLKPLPVGAIGELYIGGIALAKGYLNLSELTQKLFIPNPLQSIEEKVLGENKRLYKTGDLVRYLPDGNIEYIGRQDTQVKIRGYRIELAEIEAKLSGYPGVKQSVVLPREQTNINGSEKILVAYYVADTKLDEDCFLEYLSQKLPDYMLPSFLIYLDQMPLTRNGKLNVHALPQPHTIARNNYIAPKSEAEQEICKAYAEILKLPIDQINANDNFFRLGGNSISAIRLAFKLQIPVNEIFEYKTPVKLAQLFITNNSTLVNKLEQIKLIYSRLALEQKFENEEVTSKRNLSRQQIESHINLNESKPTSKVLLTGAAGYLGCHLLYELLTATSHIIYLPIRTSPKESSYAKLCDKFKYYFNEDLNEYNNRIKVFPSDLSKVGLGVDKRLYDELINSIDSIIHSAALVKHYGASTRFHQENVQSTVNLLELAKLTTNKDFHYISTIGVFTNLRTSSSTVYNIFAEENISEKSANMDNIYTKTKYQGEQIALTYRKYGVNTNIYRVGNMAVNSTTQKPQENVSDNAFLQRIKAILKLGIIAKEISEVEVSSVDCTAKAIILLFNQKLLNNEIYHLFNPDKYDLYKLFCEDKTIPIKLVSLSEFIDTIAVRLKNGEDTRQLELFMLHQWWLQPNVSALAKTVILQDKTKHILDQLKFKWSSATPYILYNTVKSLL